MSRAGRAARTLQHSAFGFDGFSAAFWLECIWRTWAFPMYSGRREEEWVRRGHGGDRSRLGSCPGDPGGPLLQAGVGQAPLLLWAPLATREGPTPFSERHHRLFCLHPGIRHPGSASSVPNSWALRTPYSPVGENHVRAGWVSVLFSPPALA